MDNIKNTTDDIPTEVEINNNDLQRLIKRSGLESNNTLVELIKENLRDFNTFGSQYLYNQDPLYEKLNKIEKQSFENFNNGEPMSITQYAILSLAKYGVIELIENPLKVNSNREEIQTFKLLKPLKDKNGQPLKVRDLYKSEYELSFDTPFFFALTLGFSVNTLMIYNTLILNSHDTKEEQQQNYFDFGNPETNDPKIELITVPMEILPDGKKGIYQYEVIPGMYYNPELDKLSPEEINAHINEYWHGRSIENSMLNLPVCNMHMLLSFIGEYNSDLLPKEFVKFLKKYYPYSVYEQKTKKVKKQTIVRTYDEFEAMKQSGATQSFSKIIVPKGSKTIGDGYITGIRGNLTWAIDDFNNTQGMRPSTHKLLNYASVLATKQISDNDNQEITVSFSLEEYARLKHGDMNIEATPGEIDSLRREVKADMETLFKTRLSWKDTAEKSFADVRILSVKGAIKDNNVFMVFTSPMVKQLAKSGITQFPMKALAIPNDNITAYWIYTKMAEQYFNTQNRLEGRYNHLKVETLLKNCPSIPTYESVKGIGGIQQRIINPFDKAIDYLESNKYIKNFEYCNEKGTVLTDEQLTNWNYNIFVQSYISFDIPGRELTPEEKQQAKERKQNKAKIARDKKVCAQQETPKRKRGRPKKS